MEKDLHYFVDVPSHMVLYRWWPWLKADGLVVKCDSGCEVTEVIPDAIYTECKPGDGVRIRTFNGGARFLVAVKANPAHDEIIQRAFIKWLGLSSKQKGRAFSRYVSESVPKVMYREDELDFMARVYFAAGHPADVVAFLNNS